jgi:5-methyltetrahydrofolate--homocysteine methyltransferase
MMKLLEKIRDDLYKGDTNSVTFLIQQALDSGMSPAEILERGLIEGMNRVGEDFRDGILFVPEVLIAARAMHAGMDLLKPLLADSEIKAVGKFVIGTVKGDLHDIGKNLVGMMMEGAGFEVIDLGVDTPPEKFIKAVKEYQPDLLGMSALLTTTMVEMKRVIEALREAGLRDKVRVIVGGAPVTQSYAQDIGADGYAPNAAAAVEKARELLGTFT